MTVSNSDLLYRTLVTDIGHQKEAAVAVSGPKLNIVEAAVGDGDYTPTGAETALVNEVWRGPIASMAVNEDSPNMYDVRVILDSTVGGFTVREVGLFDEDGDLIVIANVAPVAKAVILEGMSAKLDIMMHVLFTNPDAISFTVDPNVDSVSAADLDAAIAKHNTDPTAHSDLSGGTIAFASLTIPADGWTTDESESGGGGYVNTVACEKATADALPIVTLTREYTSVAESCGLSSYGAETDAGAVIFRASNAPETDIPVSVLLLCEGAVFGSSAASAVASATTLGSVMVGSGLSIDSSGRLSVNIATDAEAEEAINDAIN